MFSENVFSDEEILEKNMLYRPCLIKLNGKYHLREQKLPFFITLAHEFSHALNQLERIREYNSKLDLVSECPTDISERLDSQQSLQVFLSQKLEIKECPIILQEKYTPLWENDNADDSLDEMTVILGSNRQISDEESVFIGETTFLQEFYGKKTIISWTHCNAHDYKFYINEMNTSLESEYVNCVLEKFYGAIPILEDTTPSDDGANIILFVRKDLKYNDCITARENTEAEVKKDLEQPKIVRLKQRNGTIFQFILYPQLKNEKLLPIFSSRQTTLTINGYTIIDVPADGNCAFTAVKVAQGDKNFEGKIQELTSDQLNIIIALREAIADKMKVVAKDHPNFIKMLPQPGFWNNGINGAIGIEVLCFVAEEIGKPILVITQEQNGQYRYWISGTTENPRGGNLNFHDIEERNLESLLNANPNAIKLFHNGIHFQAIVKKETSLTLPPLPAPSFKVESSNSVTQEKTSPTTGTPPHPTEGQETIPVKLSAGYHIRNVTGDGNCGVWALLQAMNPKTDFFQKTLEQKTKMVNLRRAVGDIVPATDNDAKTRISTSIT